MSHTINLRSYHLSSHALQSSWIKANICLMHYWDTCVHLVLINLLELIPIHFSCFVQLPVLEIPLWLLQRLIERTTTGHSAREESKRHQINVIWGGQEPCFSHSHSILQPPYYGMPNFLCADPLVTKGGWHRMFHVLGRIGYRNHYISLQCKSNCQECDVLHALVARLDESDLVRRFKPVKAC